MWMGLTGLGGETLTKYGEEFNKMQNEYKVVVSFRGQYPSSAPLPWSQAFRAGNPPHIMQMFDAGSGDMMGASRTPSSRCRKCSNAPACSSTPATSSPRPVAITA